MLVHCWQNLLLLDQFSIRDWLMTLPLLATLRDYTW
jgi:hypothetical protein